MSHEVSTVPWYESCSPLINELECKCTAHIFTAATCRFNRNRRPLCIREEERHSSRKDISEEICRTNFVTCCLELDGNSIEGITFFGRIHDTIARRYDEFLTDTESICGEIIRPTKSIHSYSKLFCYLSEGVATLYYVFLHCKTSYQ